MKRSLIIHCKRVVTLLGPRNFFQTRDFFPQSKTTESPSVVIGRHHASPYALYPPPPPPPPPLTMPPKRAIPPPKKKWVAPSDESDDELSDDDCEVVGTNAALRAPTKKLAPTKRRCALQSVANKRKTMASTTTTTTTRGKKARATPTARVETGGTPPPTVMTGEHYPILSHASGRLPSHSDVHPTSCAECGPLLSVDTLMRCVAVHVVDGHVTIFPINQGYDMETDGRARRNPWRRNATGSGGRGGGGGDQFCG